MDKIKNNNWLSIILNTEFQDVTQFKTLVEVSMVSKLAREMLKPIVFERVNVHYANIKLESSIFSKANDKRIKNIEYDYHALREENYRAIEDSIDYLDLTFINIKKFSKSFKLLRMYNSGYFLFPIICSFENLTSLTIMYCNIPFTAFSIIGKQLLNLNNLHMLNVNLVKSSTDIIASSDISLPPNLTRLIINSNQVVTIDLLLDHYEYLFDKNSYNHSYEKNSNINIDLGVEEFLNSNPQLETLDVSTYNLKMNSNLNSIKFLRVDDKICFDSIKNVSNLNSISTLIFNMHSIENTENFRKFCMLCNNLTELRLSYQRFNNCQVFINEFLIPALPTLFKLKTLQIDGIHNIRLPKTFNFAKFNQIEQLVLSGSGPVSKIKFDKCKKLKRVKFTLIYYKVDEDNSSVKTMEKFYYRGWNFKYEGNTIFGNKT
ncbi:hypothetical protein CONCODRAFT_12592 [Conidiobolus coronatus NRRL 28638]|uniref:RNI-like protein n=1 Tax=Conidiobolus coronatus (strain ATCC 28846 / CBS 209.66 / NRRL 28638) TaxID=796925 RepID=A0A137NSJ4_CONC2|nr:hypothetical protein CONCODRAFT_12592 [Conidiobolus coronatus NRRL 28638]|eukprot:KXN65735.1 hypothetical protein CONCODRAFT_12592 [Conidiobolus coronatus NRRL 28638]